MPPVRTRFAPSPTGRLHVGNARTALLNLLFARRRNGGFVLRIEDTDVERSSVAYEDAITEDLSWLGIDWDEGPDKKGPHGPYRQSERLSIYSAHAQKLIEKGLAYWCYCSKERLETLKAEQIRRGIPPRYDNRCRAFKEAPPDGAPPALRFKVPAKNVAFNDGVHDGLSFDASIMGDFVIAGSDGIASYNFAVVVDDALMEITHIIRGDDHLSNTPRQILLYEAFGFAPPEYFHVPLVLSVDKTPLGKRDGAASLKGLREEGFLPLAVLNAIARLGWSPGREGVLGLDEMIRAFDGTHLSVSPSVFDPERLKAYNKTVIGEMPGAELLGLSGLPEEPDAVEAADAVKANASTIKEFAELAAPFIREVEPDNQAIAILNEPGSKTVLKAAREAVLNAVALDEEACGGIISEVKKKTGAKGRALFMPIRAALTGRTEGIELANILKLLGRERAAKRLERFAS